jgi:hypothetical protein
MMMTTCSKSEVVVAYFKLHLPLDEWSNEIAQSEQGSAPFEILTDYFSNASPTRYYCTDMFSFSG